jgi:phytoene dehydrogenase-like protein
MHRVVVVGAGHNGLVTAFYLAKAGLRPLVLERRAMVGGAAVTEEIAGGVRGPALAHAIGPLRPSIVRDMRLAERGVAFVEPDPPVVALGKNGEAVAFHRDVARAQQSIAKLSPKDAARYPAFCDSLSRLGRVVGETLEMTPPDVDRTRARELWKLLSAGRRFRALPKQDAFRLLRWMPMAVADVVGEFFEHELVQAAIAARALMGTSLGPWAAGTGALLLLHAAADPHPAGPALTVTGGPGALTAAMAQAALEAGAEIRTGAAVARIEVGSQGVVEGVRLESGEVIPARAAISNADPRRTFLGLLDPTVLEPGFVWRVGNYRSQGATAKINMVVSGAPVFTGATPSGYGRIHIGPSLDYLERAFDSLKYGRYADDPWLDLTVPSLTDASLADGGRHVVSVVAHAAPYRLRDADWQEAREPFGDRVVRTLEEYAPGFSQTVIARQVYLPGDLELRYGLTGGHIHHGEPGLDQLFVMRPIMGWARYRTPVQRLYLCGGGTHPGLGMTGGSGQNAAREILKDLS